MFNFLTKMFHNEDGEPKPKPKPEEYEKLDDVGTEEETPNIICSISYFMTEDGIINTDLGIIDHQPKSLKNFAALMSAVSSFQVRLDVLEIVKDALDETGNKKLFGIFAKFLIEEDNKAQEEISDLTGGSKLETDPYITPSELFEKNNRGG